MSDIKVISFNGQDLETGFSAYFRVADAVRTRVVTPSVSVPSGKRARLTATQHTPVTIPVQIHVTSGTLLTQLDQLDEWFDPGVTGPLRIRIGDTDVRKVSATVTRTLPYDGSPNKYTVVFTVPDGRWLSDVAECWDGGGLTWSGNELTDTTRAAGTEGDGQPDVDSVGVWEGTTNLVLNGGFETDTTGYLAYGTNTIAVSTEQAKFGAQSLKCTVGNTNRMMVYGGAASAATTYSISAWIYIPSSWTGVVDPAFTILHTVGTSTVDFRVPADVTVKDQWQRMTCRVLTGGTVSDIGIEIGFPSGGTATEFIYIDGLQMEALNHPTPYVETDGGTDSRSDARVQVNAQDLDETTGWCAFRVRSGFTEDPSGSQVHAPASLFYWQDNSSNRLWLRYEDSTSGTGNWRFLRRGGGVGTGSQQTAALTRGQEVTVIARWTSTVTGVSVDGAAFSDSANTGIPTLAAANADLGSNAGTSEHWDGDIVWFAAGTGTLTDDDAATIHASGNALPSRFPSAAGRCLTWLADDLVDDQVQIHATNDGTVETDDLVVTLQPLSAKPGTNDWVFRRQVVMANRSDLALPDWALELTNGGWDHAAAVPTDSRSDGNDVRAYVNGREVPRWSGGAGTTEFNQTGTKLWANIPHSGGKSGTLLVAMASGASPAVGETIAFPSGTMVAWPVTGTMLIGTEAIDYSGLTIGDTDTVTVVARGARGTTAAAHSAGALAYWVEHRVEVIYGNLAAAAPANADHLKPLITLSTSSNLEHVWTQFSDDDNPRSMQWARVQRQRDSQFDKMLAPGGSPTSSAIVRYRSGGPVAGSPAFNGWTRSVPCGTRYGASNHPLTVSNLVVDASIIAQFYGIDEDGNEVPLLNEGKGATDISASTDADDPDAPVYSLELSARNGIVVASPGGEYAGGAGGVGGVDLTATDGLVTNGNPLAQPFTVPDSLDDAAYIDRIAILARCNAGLTASVVLNVSIAQDDGAGGFVAFGTDQTTVSYDGLSTAYIWHVVTLTEPVRVTPGQQLYVYVEWDSVGSGSPTSVGWYTIQQSFENLLISHATRVMSTTLDAGPNAVGVDGDDMTAQAATIFYNDIDNTYPYVAFGAEEALYWLDGTLTNAATGASVSFAVPVALDDEVVIDVAARTVRNATAGLSVLNAVSFSSGDWLSIEPGANLLTYAEDSMVSVRVKAEWSHRWLS